MMHGRGLSDAFLSALRSIDRDLKAVFDETQDAIIIWSERPGQPRVHEFTSRRTFTEDSEFYDMKGAKIQKQVVLSRYDLEGWTLKRLKEADVWNRFGRSEQAGKKFEECLFQQEEAVKEVARKKFLNNRLAYLKDHRRDFKEALENLKSGRMYETPDQFLTKAQRAKKPKPNKES